MAKLFWLICGFFGGVIVTRNAAPMSQPATAAIFLAFIVGMGIMWFAGYRGKKEAVSSAVAVAMSVANANANAAARAAASSAINLYLGAQSGITPELIGSIVDESVQEIRNVSQNENTFQYAVTTEKEPA